jgi:hypothetical protein
MPTELRSEPAFSRKKRMTFGIVLAGVDVGK